MNVHARPRRPYAHLTLSASAALLLTGATWRATGTAPAAEAPWAVFALGLVALVVGLFLTVQARRQSRQLGERYHHLRWIHGLLRTVSRSLNLDEVLYETLRQTVDNLGADAGVIWLETGADGTADSLHLVSFGLSERQIAAVQTMGSRLSHADEVVSIMLCDVDNESAPELGLICGELETTQVTLVPIHRGAQGFGTLALWKTSGSLGTEAPALLKSVAMAVGGAIENARAYNAACAGAERDPVTGLYNHRAVFDRLESELKRAARGKCKLAVVMMDINLFKALNDTHGHPVGDEILRSAADCLRRVCRGTDIVARYGGDEFIAVLPETCFEEASQMVRRLQEAVEESPYTLAHTNQTVTFSMSFGISVYPDDGTDSGTLVAVADARLYQYKQDSRANRPAPDRDTFADARAAEAFLILEEIVHTIGKRDDYTDRHAQMVTNYALMLARAMGLSSETMRTLRMAGLIHNVGMIGVPDHVLCKPAKLTPEEVEIIRRHPTLGYQIVAALPGMESIAEIIRSHHERYDGDGYPDGLSGERIPLLARLLSVADAFSAMLIDRPHRKAQSKMEALEELRRSAGSQFDARVVETFAKAIQQEIEEEKAA